MDEKNMIKIVFTFDKEELDKIYNVEKFCEEKAREFEIILYENITEYKNDESELKKD